MEEQLKKQKALDEEYARKLQDDMNEEIMIQQAIAISLKEIDHTPTQAVLSSQLNLNCAEFKPQKQRKGKVVKKYMPKK